MLRSKSGAKGWLIAGLVLAWTTAVWAADVSVDTSPAGRRQTIDGFGAHQGSPESNQAYWRNLFFDDMRCSMLRVDLTPPFKSPYSDHSYVSPWYGQAAPLNLPGTGGPDGNNVRTYTNASDYTRSFGGFQAPIAVMGPDIDQNGQYFSFSNGTQNSYDGPIAQLAKTRAAEPADFKLTGSFWSPEPWVKIASGHTYPSGSGSGYPTAGTPWPFIWGGNYAGGRIDVSDTPLAVFDDSAMTSGTGPTSALTQFARSGAAYLRAYQNQYNVKFYAISIQNELNFEEFYNSATYPLSSQYIAALKRFRAELDKYPDLATIKIMGPEDLLGSGWGMWQLGGDTDKNLRYLQNIGQDPAALAAISQFCIHGYAANGTTSAGSNPVEWDQWANGWTSAPASGLPANVKGFTYYRHAGAPTVQLKSWMTETSGEDPAWLHSTGVEYDGGWSIALKIYQALTVGQQSAWEYWTFAKDYNPADPSTGTNGAYDLTGRTVGANAPKYVAAKHFFHYIRPNSQAVTANVTGSATLLASAFIHDAKKTLTAVFVNSAAADESVTFHVPAQPGGITAFGTFTSSNNSYWQPTTNTVNAGVVTVNVPAYGVVTLFGVATGAPPVQPVNVTPADGASGVSLTLTLTASAFGDPDAGDTHGASQWQIRTAASPTSYTVTTFDSGTTTALTSAVVPAGILDGNVLHSWHVRYQDNRGQWSAWSAETTFTTIPAPPINHPPNTPTNVSPAAGATNVALPVTLSASAFSDRNTSDTHAASQWQVRTTASLSNWSVVAFDSATTTSLTSVVARPGVLFYTTAYTWHVRYRDSGALWSAWSAETTFTTGAVPGTDHAPVAPTNASPTSGALNVALPVTLRASAFSDSDLGDHQIAARWQVRPTTGTWTTLTYDSNTLASTTNTCVVPAGRLAYNYSYTWRVRYRDSRSTWGAYSTPTPFTVMPVPIPPNAPTNISPAAGATHVALPATLRASPYSAPQAWNVQTGSQWEVRPTTGTWASLAYDSGPVATTDTCVISPGTLMWSGAYTWRARYRDSSNAWSPWSTGTPFLVMPRPPATWMVK